MQLFFRTRPGPLTRSSGFRQRSAAGQERRNKKKAKQGWGPLAEIGRSSGSQRGVERRGSGSQASSSFNDAREGDAWGAAGSWTWNPRGWQAWWESWQG